MQKNEVIIEQFIKTIKESPLDKKGDPVLLNKIFEELDKKKKRTKFWRTFLLLALGCTGLGLVIGVFYHPDNGLQKSKNAVAISKYETIDMQGSINTLKDLKEKKEDIVPVKKRNRIAGKKKENYPINVISYKFNDHQIDIFREGSQDFIEINIFSNDRGEEDVFKIIEDLKASFRNNELYVDTIIRK